MTSDELLVGFAFRFAGCLIGPRAASWSASSWMAAYISHRKN